MAPKFSIIIPTLNEEKFLPKLLMSLTRQTRQDFEVIVVDGTSEDKTVEKAKEFEGKLPNFRVIVDGRGVSHQRNMGAREAKAKWLIFVDADGELLPYFFERIELFIQKRKPKLFSTWFIPDSEHTGDAIITLLANITLEGSISVKRPFAPGPLTLVQRDAFFSIGGYDETKTFAEDYDLSRRLDAKGVRMNVLREALSVMSLRRYRKEGRLRVVQTHALAALSAFILRSPPKNDRYITGGHLYDDMQKPMRRTAFKRFQTQLTKLTKELFE